MSLYTRPIAFYYIFLKGKCIKKNEIHPFRLRKDQTLFKSRAVQNSPYKKFKIYPFHFKQENQLNLSE